MSFRPAGHYERERRRHAAIAALVDAASCVVGCRYAEALWLAAAAIVHLRALARESDVLAVHEAAVRHVNRGRR